MLQFNQESKYLPFEVKFNYFKQKRTIYNQNCSQKAHSNYVQYKAINESYSIQNMFEINYSQLIQYGILEKLVTFIPPINLSFIYTFLTT